MLHLITSRRHSPRVGLRAAFTLVELLVVIGIIAVLISILLPSLAKARQAALTAACLSNLRQIGLGFHLYADNNRGYFPGTGHGATFGYDDLMGGGGSYYFNMSWSERVVRDGALPYNPAGSPPWFTHNPVGGRGGPFKCPNYGEGAYERGQTGAAYSGYGMNRFISPDLGGGKSAFGKLSKLNQERIMLVDGYLRIPVGTYSATGTYAVYLRHSGGANYLFPDGHAEWSIEYHNQGYMSAVQYWQDTKLYEPELVNGTWSNKIWTPVLEKN